MVCGERGWYWVCGWYWYVCVVVKGGGEFFLGEGYCVEC